MTQRLGDDPPKPVRWVGSSQEDLRKFPQEVRWRVGGALWEAQLGRRAPYAKPLKGFGGASVLEIVDDFDGDTFRAVYQDVEKGRSCPFSTRLVAVHARDGLRRSST